MITTDISDGRIVQRRGGLYKVWRDIGARYQTSLADITARDSVIIGCGRRIHAPSIQFKIDYRPLRHKSALESERKTARGKLTQRALRRRVPHRVVGVLLNLI